MKEYAERVKKLGQLSYHDAGLIPEEGDVSKILDCNAVVQFQQNCWRALKPKMAIRRIQVSMEWSSLVFLPCSFSTWEPSMGTVALAEK